MNFYSSLLVYEKEHQEHLLLHDKCLLQLWFLCLTKIATNDKPQRGSLDAAKPDPKQVIHYIHSHDLTHLFPKCFEAITTSNSKSSFLENR